MSHGTVTGLSLVPPFVFLPGASPVEGDDGVQGRGQTVAGGVA